MIGPFTSFTPPNVRPIKMGDTVELHDYPFAPAGVLWTGEVLAVEFMGYVVRLMNGATYKGVTDIFVGFKDAKVKRVSPPSATSTSKKCTVCKRDADAGKPCWWCGTVVPA